MPVLVHTVYTGIYRSVSQRFNNTEVNHSLEIGFRVEINKGLKVMGANTKGTAQN